MGFMQRRLDAHAHDIEVALPLLRLLAESAEVGVPVVQAVRDEGEALVETLRRGPNRGLPSPAELRHFQARTGSLIQQLGAILPDEVEGSITALDRKDARLVRSLFPEGIGRRYQLHPDLLVHEHSLRREWMEDAWLWNWTERPEEGRFYPLQLAAAVGGARFWVAVVRTLRPLAGTSLDLPSPYWRPLGLPDSETTPVMHYRALWALGWLLARRLELDTDEIAAAASECVVFYSLDEEERSAGLALVRRVDEEAATANRQTGVEGAPGDSLGTLLAFMVEPLDAEEPDPEQRLLAAKLYAQDALITGLSAAYGVLRDIEAAGGWEQYLLARFDLSGADATERPIPDFAESGREAELSPAEAMHADSPEAPILDSNEREPAEGLSSAEELRQILSDWRRNHPESE